MPLAVILVHNRYHISVCARAVCYHPKKFDIIRDVDIFYGGVVVFPIANMYYVVHQHAFFSLFHSFMIKVSSVKVHIV